MSDKKMFVFGSFSEDETKVFPGKDDDKNLTPIEKKMGFQFGSLDINVFCSVKGFGSEFKQNAATKEKGFPVTTTSKKTKDFKAGTSQAAKSSKELNSNLTVNDCVPISGEVITDERIYKGNCSVKILEDNTCIRDLSCPTVQSNELELFLNENTLRNTIASAKESKLLETSAALEPNVIANGCVPINGEIIAAERIIKGMNSTKILENDICSRDLSYLKVKDNEIEMQRNDNDLLRTAAQDAQEPSKLTPHFRGLLPRGLINSGNLCFLNSTLQALLSCSPFVQLFSDLRNRIIPSVRASPFLTYQVNLEPFYFIFYVYIRLCVVQAGYPMLQAFIGLILECCLPNDSSLKNAHEVVAGKPFSPIMFETVLKKFTPDFPSGISARPRQEDAQEFLSFLMDQMHDELLRLGGHLSCPNVGSLPLISASDDDGWETIGPKNKSAITRTQSFMQSELSAIFGGQLRSVVKARGNKASATVQPFLLLHLDILPEAIHTIEDAFHFFSAPETLEGYRAASGKQAGLVNASKSVKIQTLPKIMILHLMRFSYGNRGSTKLLKPICFPFELVMGRELLVIPTAEGRKYELVATVTHHGREHAEGHYTADCRYSNGQWLRYDDASVTAIAKHRVLHDQAYLLFYKQV